VRSRGQVDVEGVSCAAGDRGVGRARDGAGGVLDGAQRPEQSRTYMLAHRFGGRAPMRGRLA
jgi:hypothetical protein